jgi:cytochrome b561
MSKRNGYTSLQISLHWLIAILITAAYFLSEDMGKALRTRIETGATGFDGNTVHVWLGTLVLALIVLRIIVKIAQGGPAPLPGASRRETIAAHAGHGLLYLLMLIAPIAGAVAWYGGVRDVAELHEVTSNALFLLAILHAAIALWHQFGRKDGSLMRMLKPAK